MNVPSSNITQAPAGIVDAGGCATAIHLDVTDPAGWTEAISRAVEAFGGLDVLVNNAGLGDLGAVEDVSYETYRRVIEVSQDSVFLGQKAASDALARSAHGAVVNVSSMFGIVGGFGNSPPTTARKAPFACSPRTRPWHGRTAG